MSHGEGSPMIPKLGFFVTNEFAVAAAVNTDLTEDGSLIEQKIQGALCPILCS